MRSQPRVIRHLSHAQEHFQRIPGIFHVEDALVAEYPVNDLRSFQDKSLLQQECDDVRVVACADGDRGQAGRGVAGEADHVSVDAAKLRRQSVEHSRNLRVLEGARQDGVEHLVGF